MNSATKSSVRCLNLARIWGRLIISWTSARIDRADLDLQKTLLSQGQASANWTPPSRGPLQEDHAVEQPRVSGAQAWAISSGNLCVRRARPAGPNTRAYLNSRQPLPMRPPRCQCGMKYSSRPGKIRSLHLLSQSWWKYNRRELTAGDSHVQAQAVPLYRSPGAGRRCS